MSTPGFLYNSSEDLRLQPLNTELKARSSQLSQLQGKLKKLQRELERSSEHPKDSVRFTSRERTTEPQKSEKKKKKPQPGGRSGTEFSLKSPNMMMGSGNPHGPIALEHHSFEQEELKVSSEPLTRNMSNSMMMGSAQIEPSSTPEPQPVENNTIDIAPTAEEVVQQVNDTVKETMGDGITAVNQQIEETAQQVKELQATTRTAQEAISTEAPRFSADLTVLLEKYQTATERNYQESIRLEIDALLDGTSESLKPQVDKVREQTRTLYEKTAIAWESRTAALEMKKPDAQQLSKEQQERSPIAGTGKQHLEQQYRDRAQEGRLADQLRLSSQGKRDLVSELNNHGALT